jgi:hypothetical protein
VHISKLVGLDLEEQNMGIPEQAVNVDESGLNLVQIA